MESVLFRGAHVLGLGIPMGVRDGRIDWWEPVGRGL